MRETRRTPRAVAAAAAVLALGVPSGELFAESTINLSAHSAYVSEAHAPAHTTEWLSNVPIGHAVAIRCQVHVAGDAHSIDPKPGSGYGASTWQLTSKQGKGFTTLTFTPALKVALLVDGQTVTVATIDQLALNAALPQPGSYPFDNSGKLHVVSADWVFTSAGTHTLQCLVDAGHTVKETKEADNQAARKVSVTGPTTQQGPTTSGAHGTPPVQQPVTTRGDPGRVAARSPERQKNQKQTKPAPGGRRSSGAFDPGAAYPGVPMSRGPVAVQAFQAPTWKGRRVDWCLHAGSQCGAPAAAEFCKRMGYPKTTGSTMASNVGQKGSTLLLGDEKLCATPVCHGFASITCSQ